MVAEVCVDAMIEVCPVDSRDVPGYEEDNGVEVSLVTEDIEVVEEGLSTVDRGGASAVKG